MKILSLLRRKLPHEHEWEYENPDSGIGDLMFRGCLRCDKLELKMKPDSNTLPSRLDEWRETGFANGSWNKLKTEDMRFSKAEDFKREPWS